MVVRKSVSCLCRVWLLLAGTACVALAETADPLARLILTLESLKVDPETARGLLDRETAPPPAPIAAEDLEFFEKKIRPVLIEHCLQCHGPDQQKGGLRLDSAAATAKGGDGGPVILKDDPDASPLARAVGYLDPNLQMPPSGKLPDSVVEDLREWVRRGAPDSRTGEPTETPSAESAIDFKTARQFWSFQPIGDPEPLQVQNSEWVRNPIDAFLLAEMEKAGIEPSPPASKRTWLRRVTFDLTGLPPTPAEVEDYLADESPEAEARVVERLLSSPHYGERWGRHWLDVVRYTDSFDSRATAEQDVTESWKYRDWVVRSFNEDKPINRFFMEQIAGDLLPSPDRAEGFNRDGVIATGMLAIGNWPGGDADKEKMVTDIVDDQIDVISRGMMGLTVACARCHDHKFDPISTRDYYGLAGIFFSSHILPSPGRKTDGSSVLKIPLLAPEELEKRKADEARLAEVRARKEALLEAGRREKAAASLSGVAARLDAAAEFRGLSDNGGRPSLAGLAEAKGIPPADLFRWLGFLGFEKRRLFSKEVRDLHGVPGLVALLGERPDASATVNRADENAKYLSISQPPRSLAVHPSPVHPVIVGWRAPGEGVYRIEGGVSDADANGGDGVAWSLEVEPASGGKGRSLGSGDQPNGQSRPFESLAGAESLDAVALDGGDMVLLSILPKTSHGWDTTVIDLRISEVGKPDRMWKAAEDFLNSDPLANPAADREGRSEAWWIMEPAERGEVAAAGSALLAEWKKEIGERVLGAAADPDVKDWVSRASARIQERLEALAVLDATAQASSTDPLAAVQREMISAKGPFSISFTPEDLGPAAHVEWTRLTEEEASLEPATQKPLEFANGIQEGGVPETPYAGVQDVRVHIRGHHSRLGEVVPRGFPVVLAGGSQPGIRAGSGRLELARWVTSETHPLTARVFVNRIWRHHFGEGIVRTPGDFGRQGEPPTHPELLDWLGREFIRSGWSVKSMHRLMVLSSAYRQASESTPALFDKDGDNRLFARMNRRRLEAESIRDSLLFVSGRLDPALGGPPFIDLAVNRRTLYFKTVRSDRTSFNMLFDAADPTAIVDERNEATVAPQALFLLNHPFALDAAKSLADRILGDDGLKTDADRISALYETLYARPVTDREREIGLEAVSVGGSDPKELWTAYCQVLLCANEFIYID